MKRESWIDNWIKPSFNWDKHNRYIRKVGPITPLSPFPPGTVLILLSNNHLPEGWEWVPEAEGTVQDVRTLA